MSKPPVIFVSFANTNLKPLPSLKKEGAIIKQLFSPIADNQQIQFHLEDFADTDNLTNYFIQYKDRILIFHYGGHANSKSLLLNDQKANAQGIAYQLAQQASIQLVFLNGCSTRQQVDLLLDVGVPAVIATSVPIGDKSATHFAEKFYAALITNHTLEAAFDMAAANFETKYNHRPRIYRDVGLRDEKTEELPWGLYTKNENDVLSMQFIPNKMEQNPTSTNTNNTIGDGNIIIQGMTTTEGSVNININQFSQPKELKTQAIERILEDFTTTRDTSFKSWISSYLFENDLTLKTILMGQHTTITMQEIVGAKLDLLLQQESFKHALSQQLGTALQPIVREKNVMRDTELESDLDVHVGDKNPSKTENFDKKNIIEGGKIITKGSFRLGDG